MILIRVDSRSFAVEKSEEHRQARLGLGVSFFCALCSLWLTLFGGAVEQIEQWSAAEPQPNKELLVPGETGADFLCRQGTIIDAHLIEETGKAIAQQEVVVDIFERGRANLFCLQNAITIQIEQQVESLRKKGLLARLPESITKKGVL
jgi:hypothetical protein